MSQLRHRKGLSRISTVIAMVTKARMLPQHRPPQASLPGKQHPQTFHHCLKVKPKAALQEMNYGSALPE